MSLEVVITGTPRCGTSFLIVALAHAGIEVGFDPEARPQQQVETHVCDMPVEQWAGLPALVKTPHIAGLGQMAADLAQHGVRVIIPVRDSGDAWDSWKAKHHGARFHGDVPENIVHNGSAFMEWRLGFAVMRCIVAHVPLVLLDYHQMMVDDEFTWQVMRQVWPALEKPAFLDAAAKARDGHRF